MSESVEKEMVRSFGPTNWALKNKITIFLATIMISLFGVFTYTNLPKELFPEVTVPTIMVQTIYPGNSPVDIENLITRHLEKEIESVKGVKKLTSTSYQDVSMVIVEFNTNVDIKDAKQNVKDAVDRAKRDLPNDLDQDPVVNDIDFSEIPIINVNLSGDFSLEELKKYADYLQDQFEALPQISKANIQGIEDREIKVNIDLAKLELYNLSFSDIEGAISGENLSVSGGEIKLGATQRSVRIDGEFKTIADIESIIVKRDNNKTVYLKDVAEVKDGFAEAKTIARLDHNPVLSIQVVKKSGQNLLEAVEKINHELKKAQDNNSIPRNLVITLTNDQSDAIKLQIEDLQNNMLLGIILVLLILYYFLGTRNAMFVASAIPLSILITFITMKFLGFTVNMMTLFSLILALGMLVDDSIVVVENIYRFVDNGYKPYEAAKKATGEIAIPVITTTMTTLAAFFPLMFWEGIIGEFMKQLPITLVIVMTASLLVALVIVPVFAATYIRLDKYEDFNIKKKATLKRSLIMIGVAVLFYLVGWMALANILVIIAVVMLLNIYYFHRLQSWFMNVGLDKLENGYKKAVGFALTGKNPRKFFLATIGLFFVALVLFGLRKPNVLFFPESDPNYISVIVELPAGSDVAATNVAIKRIENDLDSILRPNKGVVESMLTTVGKVVRDNEFSGTEQPNKGMITVSFVKFIDRGGVDTKKIQRQVASELVGKYPGVIVSVEKESSGPPVGHPINIELAGEDFNRLISLSDSLIGYINSKRLDGIEGLKMNIDVGKPELLVKIDRDKARRFGLSTGQVAMAIRTALYGKEASKMKVGEDDYPIQIRLMDKYRYNLSSLLNQKIAVHDNGNVQMIPLSAVASFENDNTYMSVNRLDRKRVITVWSNVIEGYNANAINDQLRLILPNFKLPDGYTISQTGEQEEQAESMGFLVWALIIACALIYIIMVTEFNSTLLPFIIMTTVLFSFIGVIGGLATFKMDFVVIMTGIGIVSLAGIVVKNGIVLIDYIELLKLRKTHELGLKSPFDLPKDVARECVKEAGKTRLRPVILTAVCTILGLVPMAIGINIDFVGMIMHLDPNIYFGGDIVAMWKPISWAIIFGLSFATFLTLIIVPVTYTLVIDMQIRFRNRFRKH
jgi:multidrug efflux pump subunit AcrB